MSGHRMLQKGCFTLGNSVPSMVSGDDEWEHKPYSQEANRMVEQICVGEEEVRFRKQLGTGDMGLRNGGCLVCLQVTSWLKTKPQRSMKGKDAMI